jgi:glyoxylase-like metal-dependent hydrolase (beta-lactamase superfamily II)
MSLQAVTRAGVTPTEVKSILLTHDHPDHFDSGILDHLPNAVPYAHPDSNVPQCEPFDPERFGDSSIALDPPGHGGPHSSYIVDLDDFDCAVCLAGDLIMNQAHFLDRDHPLSFADVHQGKKSIETVLKALRARDRKHALVFPGHGLPFFAPPA